MCAVLLPWIVDFFRFHSIFTTSDSAPFSGRVSSRALPAHRLAINMKQASRRSTIRDG